MKRFGMLALVLACAAVIGFGHSKPARADVQFGYPQSYTLHTDLNAIGLAASVDGIQGRSQCAIAVSGTFVAGLDIYTSVVGTFSDAVKYGSEITAPTTVTIPIVPKAQGGPLAIRIQNRAYTSGDPHVSVDCSGGVLEAAGVAEPTPAATP
jgi:hypothetical protein